MATGILTAPIWKQPTQTTQLGGSGLRKVFVAIGIVKGACGHRNPHSPDLEATNSNHSIGGSGLLRVFGAIGIVKGACGHRNPHSPDLEATNSNHSIGGLWIVKGVCGHRDCEGCLWS